MKTRFLFVIMLFTLCMSGQTRTSLKGRVMAPDVPAPGLFVINKNTGTEVKTDARGEFTIAAKNGDKLVVYSTKVEEKQFYVGDDWFKNMPWILVVTPKAEEIEEVIVSDSIKINDQPGRLAVYTPAERAVNTGAKIKANTMEYQGGGVAIGIDAVFNGSEKRKQLRRELKTEQLLKNIEGIQGIYSNDQIINYLGIAPDMVDAFLYYAAEDELIAAALKEKNPEKVKMQLPVVALEYLDLQYEEVAPETDKTIKN